MSNVDSSHFEDVPDACSCGNDKFLEDSFRGQLICAKCGIVVAQGGVETKQIRTPLILRAVRYDKTPTTMIGTANVDAFGKRMPGEDIERLRRLDQMRGFVSVARKDAFNNLQKFAEKLYIGESALEIANRIYNSAAANGLLRGRSSLGLVATSLYIACRQAEVPRSIKEISEVVGINSGEIFRWEQLLQNKIDIEIPEVDPAKFLSSIASNLNAHAGEWRSRKDARVSESEQRIALGLLRRVQEARLTAGRNPKSVLAAILYIACDGTVDQRSIAIAAGVSEVTVRNTYHVLMDRLYPGTRAEKAKIA